MAKINRLINYGLGGGDKYIAKFIWIKWNSIRLRLTGAVIGKNCRIYNRLYYFLHPKGTIMIGDNFAFSSGSNFNQLSRNIRGSIYVASDASLSIGNNVGISSSCIWATKSITIGNHVNIGADTLILDTDAHHLDWKERRIGGERNSKPIVIEDDVFIGTRSIVLKGVTIGARSIIGAGSVVTKDIPSDCVAVGNPCKVIRMINQEIYE